jgi:hypothetical protein
MAMTQAELRAKIRELMASGDLPSDPPSIERRGGRGGDPVRLSGAVFGLPRAGPQVALFYTDDLAVRLHAACEALWQQERAR